MSTPHSGLRLGRAPSEWLAPGPPPCPTDPGRWGVGVTVSVRGTVESWWLVHTRGSGQRVECRVWNECGAWAETRGGLGVGIGGAARSWVPAALFTALSWDTALGGVGAATGAASSGQALGLGWEPLSRSVPLCSFRSPSPSRLLPSGSQPPASFAAASVPPKTQIPIWPVSAGCAVVYHGWQRQV